MAASTSPGRRFPTGRVSLIGRSEARPINSIRMARRRASFSIPQNSPPEYQARMLKAVKYRKNVIEYDPLSQCHSPTYPRWFDLPFLREFIVTPNQTTMIAEAFNSIRRIYTDGRSHLPLADQYPTETGDAVGFWVGETLVVHTNESMAHIYERAHRRIFSDQVEGIEVWRKVDAKTVVANVWIYDPPALAEPWYTRQSFTMLPNPDKSLRINNWSCKGSSNNEVYETKEGGSQHAEFTFMKGNSKDASKDAPKDAPKENPK